MSDSLVAYQAKWIITGEQPPIENGILLCRNQRIEIVGKGIDVGGAQLHDLGEVAIIPGLINAHTHLEFSNLNAPLGDPSAGFTAWIESVIAHRIQQADQVDTTQSIQKGIEESLNCGVVAIGEIASTPWDSSCYDPRVKGIVFHEQLGNNPLEAIEKTKAIEKQVDVFKQPNWSAGISPHAPYSTGLTLFQQLVDSAIERGKPLAMHLAETLEEVEFVETGKGAFADMLDRLGVPFNRTGPLKIADYLERLSGAHSLIIHGNFLNSDELEIIAESEKLHLVFCPRTHRYFGHPEYPLRTMLDLKINVAIGTDSRASNPDLCLFSEMKRIAETQPSVSPEEILQMGTLNGARALQLNSQLGSLVPGKLARFALIEGLGSGKPFESLFSESTICKANFDFHESD